MLSFMKNQQSSGNLGQEESGPNSDAGEDQEFYTVSGRDKKARNSTAFFMALLVIGALGLWFMSHKIKSRSAGASELSEETQIEVA